MSDGATYAWYGDDLTGATDTLATIVERGYRAIVFLGVPTPMRLAEAGEVDAIGLAGATRTMCAPGIAAELEPIGEFFAEQGVRVIHYKCCSTFDSAPNVGNLVAATRALLTHAEDATVAVIGGQPSLGRYCAFSNVFAAHNQLVHRLDRHPTMSCHPATPMSEADLRLHLEALGAETVGAVNWIELEERAADALADGMSAGDEFIVIDALTGSHVERIGDFMRRSTARRIWLGASSVAEAYFAPRETGLAVNRSVADGPVLALAGSLSSATRAQVAAATRYRKLALSPHLDDAGRSALAAEASGRLAAGENVLLITAPSEASAPVAAAKGFAGVCGELLDQILTLTPVRRIAIAGGDTSSSATQALRVWGLDYAGRAGKGICVCRTLSELPERDGLQLLLKGGQLGEPTLFDDFAAGKEYTP